MKTLFPRNLNWTAFTGVAIVVRIFFSDLSFPSYLAVVLSLHQFYLLFSSLGYVVPVRYLLGAFMCVQFFIGPTLAYNGLDQYQYAHYKMKIPEIDYFDYAIPAVMSFIIGLHLYAGNLDGEIVDEKGIVLFVEKNPKVPYIFIAVGFMTSLVSGFFSSEIAFVFYLLGSFKFIGLFLLVLGTDKIKIVPLVIVIGSIVSSSLGDGMFHDLLTWIIFTGSIFGIKYKFGINTKIIACTAFIFLVVMIQALKGSYRSATYGSGEAAGLETFSKVYEQQNENSSIFSFERLAPANVRINQGFIITNIMSNVPSRTPYARGEEMYQIFEAAILPRIFAPNKLTAGNRELFVKYSGIQLRAGTSMGLSSLGDAYANYGAWGGCLFMFLLGLLYSGILTLFYKQSKTYPVLILFTALSFYYPIRPDCELQTILGHLFKSCVLLAAMIFVFKKTFKVANFTVSNFKRSFS